jgi:G3E family GTPase
VDSPIPVTVVTGFLGAGKSTLLERWLQELPGDTAVIVNEQGDVGIDGALLSDRASRLLEITGGCVCCTTQAALDAALADFARASPPPSRILVETSGAASPAGVIRALTLGTARDELRLDGVVTVLDAARAPRALKIDLAIEQLGFADVVVLSHVDECDGPTLRALSRTLPDYAPAAVHVQARHGRVDADQGTLVEILAARDEALREVPAGHGGSHPAIDAVSMVFDGEVDEDRFADWVQTELGARQPKIARVKGIVAVRGVDERVILQGVGEAVEVTVGRPWGKAPRTTRMVVLGLDLDADALQAGFAACTVV